MFAKPQYPMERNTFRLSNGATKVLSMVIRNTFEGKTDQLPEAWHRKLVIAMAHDDVTIENERLMSDVVLDGDYDIDWQDFLNYPIAQADFKVQVTPFDATNSNCQTCDEMTQLSLVDDTTTDVWAEGTTNEFPDILTANDSICCSPYVITLEWWNTLYFSSVTLSESGVLTATVIDPAPILDDVRVAAYRVTCPDGSYDTADVYANITGSDVSFCPPPSIGGMIYIPTGSATTAQISLDSLPPLPLPSGGASWELFLTSDLATVIQSGVFPGGWGDVTITGLTAGVSYTISAISDCGGGDVSLPTTLEFQITAFASELCGQFIVTYLPSVDDPPQSISYMDCAGVIQNEEFTVASEEQICMLIIAGAETPLYFVASSADITITYSSLCNAYE